MNQLFRYEGPIVSAILKIGELFTLNILWILCCLPVFTAGAATTALCRITLNNTRKQGQGYRDFFRIFRSEFRQSTILWLLFAVSGAAFIFDWYFLLKLSAGPLRMALIVILGFVSFIYAAVITFAFPLQAQFENQVSVTLKNALLISMANPVGTIVMIAFNTIPLLLAYFLNIGILLLSIDVAFIATLDAAMLSRIFDLYIEDQTAPKEGETTDQNHT